MFEMSEQSDKIMGKLASVQQKIVVIKKEGKGKHGKFATYDDMISKLKPVLDENGLVLLQPVTTNKEGDIGIVTYLNDCSSNQFIKVWTPLIISEAPTNGDGKKITNESQEFGKSISYGLRYAIKSLFAWATGDQDYDHSDYEREENEKNLQLEMVEDLMNDHQISRETQDIILEQFARYKEIEVRKNAFRFVQQTVMPIMIDQGEVKGLEIWDVEIKKSLA